MLKKCVLAVNKLVHWLAVLKAVLVATNKGREARKGGLFL